MDPDPDPEHWLTEIRRLNREVKKTVCWVSDTTLNVTWPESHQSHLWIQLHRAQHSSKAKTLFQLILFLFKLRLTKNFNDAAFSLL